MKTSQVAKSVGQTLLDSFEYINDQTSKPMLDEALHEFGLGAPRFGKRPQELAAEELKRARDEKKIEKETAADEQNSKERSQKIIAKLQSEYQQQEIKSNKQQEQFQVQVVELQAEVAQLAKTVGVETKAHLEQVPKKIGILDLKRLSSIIRYLRMKAEDAKSASELVTQRSNAKRTTGMLAWVSGKQMKVHEQGTLQLQG